MDILFLYTFLLQIKLCAHIEISFYIMRYCYPITSINIKEYIFVYSFFLFFWLNNTTTIHTHVDDVPHLLFISKWFFFSVFFFCSINILIYPLTHTNTVQVDKQTDANKSQKHSVERRRKKCQLQQFRFFLNKYHVSK